MIVVATTVDGLAAMHARLAALGVADRHAIDAGPVRRAVVGAVADPDRAGAVVAALRADGEMAVVRPDGGVRLAAWQQRTAPVRFGDRLSLCFAWSEHERGEMPGLVELGAGGFGNGDHPTTRLLVDELIDRIRGGERVLDVGCGSGVLGLCALRLGAGQMVGMDIDPAAVEATRRHAELNGLDDRVAATLDPLAGMDGPFDVVLANVARAATVQLAPDLVRLLAPGGWLAISGLSPPQCDQVAGFLRPLVELGRRTAGDWSTIVLGHAGT